MRFVVLGFPPVPDKQDRVTLFLPDQILKDTILAEKPREGIKRVFLKGTEFTLKGFI